MTVILYMYVFVYYYALQCNVDTDGLSNQVKINCANEYTETANCIDKRIRSTSHAIKG